MKKYLFILIFSVCYQFSNAQCNGDSVNIYLSQGWEAEDVDAGVFKNKLLLIDTINRNNGKVRSHVQKNWSGIWDNVLWKYMQYDSAGNVIETINRSWNNGWQNDTSRTSNFLNGLLQSDTIYGWTTSSWVYSFLREYYYDSLLNDTLLLSKSWTGTAFENYQKIFSSYDSLGSLLSTCDYLWSGIDWQPHRRTDYFSDSIIMYVGSGSTWDFSEKYISFDSTSSFIITTKFNFVNPDWIPASRTEDTVDSLGRSISQLNLTWNGSSFDSIEQNTHQYSNSGYVSYYYSVQYLQGCDCWAMGNGFSHTEQLYGDSLHFYTHSGGETHCDAENYGYILYENGLPTFSETLNIVDICDWSDYGRREYYYYTTDTTQLFSQGRDKTICKGDSAILETALQTCVPFSVSWFPATGLSSSTILNPKSSPDTTTLYIASISDSVGHSFSDTILVTVNRIPFADLTSVGSTVICQGDSVHLHLDTAFTPYMTKLYKVGGYYYLIFTSDFYIKNTGSYYVVTTAGGCSWITDTISVVVNPAPTFTSTIQNATMNGNCDGTISILPNNPNAQTILWQTGQTTFSLSNLCAGTYYFTITDSLGCHKSDSVLITQPQMSCDIYINAISPTCSGLCNGYIYVVANNGTPPFQYSWSTGDSTGGIYNLCQGQYFVIGTDAHGCIDSVGIFISAPSPLSVFTSSTAATCFGCNDGTVTGTFTGGVGPYFYVLQPTGPTNSTGYFTGLAAGNYQLCVTDGNNCTACTPVTVTQPASSCLVSVVSVNTILCFGDCTGSLLAVANGVPPFHFLWSTTDTIPNLNNLCAGLYTVVMTDSVGCIDSSTVVVTQPPLLEITTQATGTTCAGCSDGTLISTATGGTPPYTYLVTPTGLTCSNCMNMQAGIYTVCVTDANGCTTCVSDTVLDDPTGIISVGENEFVKIYPNPATDEFTISCFQFINGELEIRNALGQILYSDTFESNPKIINAKLFSAGIYFVKIFSSENVVTAKLIISK